MEHFICVTCGTQFSATEASPERCPICEEERQYVPASGQNWTTLPRLRRSHMITFRYDGDSLGIGTSPGFGIGQRALLLRTEAGNVLWDCVSLVDRSAVEFIRHLGGLAAIAISHPHYYTSMVEWSAAFNNAPIHLHAADRQWVMRPDARIAFWTGESKQLLPGLTLIRTGGHFKGGTILHSQHAHEGRGALYTGDLVQVVADGKHLAFMRSYPNFIPLGATSVCRIADRIRPWAYDAIYGAWWDKVVLTGGQNAMAVSVARHLHWLQHDVDD